MSKFPAVLRWPSQCTAKHSQLGSVQPQVDNTEHFQWTLAVMLWNFSVKVKELAAFQNFIPHLFGNTYPGGRESCSLSKKSPTFSCRLFLLSRKSSFVLISGGFSAFVQSFFTKTKMPTHYRVFLISGVPACPSDERFGAAFAGKEIVQPSLGMLTIRYSGVGAVQPLQIFLFLLCLHQNR